MWRKNPTMPIKNMVKNYEKAQHENHYIASAKFKHHTEKNENFVETR